MIISKKFGINKTPILFGVLFFLFSLLPAQAVEYGGIGGRPANPRPDEPRTESIFIHTVDPGGVVDDGIRVINNTPETKDILVYAVDSAKSTGGAFACEQIGNPQNEVGTWITMDKSELTLGSLTSEVVSFTINIPESASVGEHNGCIIIQEKKEPTASAGGGIKLSFRTGLRIALLVPGDVTRRLEMVGLEVNPKGDNWLLRPAVENLGNVSIDADVKVKTSYLFGPTLAEHGGQYPILRGQVSSWSFELERPFWGGWYKSQLIVEYDANPEAGVGVKSGKDFTRIVSDEVMFFSMPSAAGLTIEILVLFVIIVVIALLALAQRRKRWIKNKWVSYTVEAGDDVKSLATKYRVSWKLIVKANKLKPPFSLQAGDSIKVPPAEE